ncbi:MAG: pentapeptide repeat-containing protein, partial [Clostridia bacterium]|nr:pentapeptide repeat-containing protein [Clostridia bacterium]
MAESFREMVENAMDEGTDIDSVRFSADAIEDLSAFGITVSASEFNSCSFIQCAFERVNFAFVKFNHCDFQSIPFNRCSFHNCEFINCRLTGADMVDNVLRHTAFTVSMMEYVNLSSRKLTDSSFSGCRFTNGYLNNMT